MQISMAKSERISALMDGELQDDRVVGDLAQQPECSATWERYHLIGEALRDDLPSHLHLDLSARVAEALENEPVLLVPRARNQRLARLKPFLRGLLGQGGQYAIAASVAAAMILGVQHYRAEDGSVGPVPVLNTVPVGGMAAPVSVNYASDSMPSPLRQGQQRPLTEEQLQQERQRINAFLRDHQLQQRLHQSND